MNPMALEASSLNSGGNLVAIMRYVMVSKNASINRLILNIIIKIGAAALLLKLECVDDRDAQYTTSENTEKIIRP